MTLFHASSPVDANESAPDPSGAALAASDPRAILRRGAGKGFAEADFIARDGLRYRARCELLRARGKPDGNLQNRGRSLHRIDEHGEILTPVESGVEPVRKKIIELTDLTFDQFRRTVLLAQGDFDAFLRASADERAALLEKITGAAIYAEISKRAFVRSKDAAQQVAALEQRRADIGLIDDEALGLLRAEQESGAAQREALRVEREAIVAELNRHERIVRAREKHEQALAERETARSAHEALSPLREKLREIERAEPLRASFDSQRREQEALSRALTDEERAALDAGAAQKAFLIAQAAEDAAAIALKATEDAIKEAAPIWLRAENLDTRIEALATEETLAREHFVAASNAAHEKREASTRVESDLAITNRDAAAARKALEDAAAAKPLSERWSEIADWLDKRAQFATDLQGTQERLTGYARDAESAQRHIAAFAEADAQDKAACETLSGQIGARQSALERIGESDAQARADMLERLATLLHGLTGDAALYADAAMRRTQAQEEARASTLALASARNRLAALSAARAEDATRSDEAERMGELAEAAASQHALRLRASLIDGEPCPVCGAREHPHAQGGDGFVAALRERRDNLRKALAQFDAQISETAASQSGATARLAQAQRAEEEARQSIERARKEYALRAAQWPQDAGLETPPEIDGAAPVLERLAHSVSVERDSIRTKLANARSLREDIDRLRKARDAAMAALEERRRDSDKIASALQTARNEITRGDAESVSLRERIESLDRSLKPFLTSLNLAPHDLDRDIAAARRRLEQAGADYGARARKLAALETMLTELAPRAAGLQAQAASAEAALALASEALAGRTRDVEALRAERATLLGGETTATHRARLQANRAAAMESCNETRAKRDSAGMAKVACEQRMETLRLAIANHREALTLAQAALARQLTTLALEENVARMLLSVTTDERLDMRARLDAADHALAISHAAVVQREADLGEAVGAGAPIETQETLAARKAELERAIDALAQRLGDILARLAADATARERAGALALEIEEASKTARSWAEINEAIGSSSGDRFRRFAQGITLERLVALANQRLAALSPRYRLERASGDGAELGLHIVDRELFDERRSTRSLSGGERFLASLALALALASLEGRDSFVDTLFIDEGFGALDAATLDMAIDALETLHGQGRKVGVISHVESLHQRIATQIRVEKRGNGKSVVRIDAPLL